MMDRVVALKIISPEIASNERVVARFQREMKLVGRLDHPNVVRAFDADQIQKVLYIVMEYVPGYSLGERLKKGPIPAAGDDRLRRPGRPGAGPCSRAGDRPSRHQAIEYPAEPGGSDQDPRPRPGRADGGGQLGDVRDGRRHRGGDGGLHVARAGVRPRRGRPERPLWPGLRDVSPDDREAAVPRHIADRAAGQADQRPARPDHRASPRDCRRASSASSTRCWRTSRTSGSPRRPSWPRPSRA